MLAFVAHLTTLLVVSMQHRTVIVPVQDNPDDPRGGTDLHPELLAPEQRHLLCASHYVKVLVEGSILQHGQLAHGLQQPRFLDRAASVKCSTVHGDI